MKRYNVYQLLYRNGLINHKNEQPVQITTESELTREAQEPERLPSHEMQPVTDTTTDESEDGIAISGGPVYEQYLHQRIYEMFGVYCPIEEEDPFAYGE